jgi:hypothetical protein
MCGLRATVFVEIERAAWFQGGVGFEPWSAQGQRNKRVIQMKQGALAFVAPVDQAGAAAERVHRAAICGNRLVQSWPLRGSAGGRRQRRGRGAFEGRQGSMKPADEGRRGCVRNM